MKKIAFLVFVLSVFARVSYADMSIGQFDSRFALRGLGHEIQEARQSLYDVYYELVKRGYFDASYTNSLILETELGGDVEESGKMILSLVDWLEKQNDRDSRFLLKKIHKVYYLELHRFFCGKNLRKDPGARPVSLCQDLYHFAVPTPGLAHELWERPFRVYLTKIALLVSIINCSSMDYYEKKETMVYALGKIKQEMLVVNSKISSIKSIDERLIKDFIELLEVHALQIPVIRPSVFRRIIFWGAVLTVVCSAGYIFYDKALRRLIADKLSRAWKGFCSNIEGLVEKAGEAGVTGAIKGVVKQRGSSGQLGIDPKVKHVIDKVEQLVEKQAKGLDKKFDDKLSKVKDLISDVLKDVDGKVDTKLEKVLAEVKNLDKTIKGAQDGMAQSWVGGLLTRKNQSKK